MNIKQNKKGDALDRQNPYIIERKQDVVYIRAPDAAWTFGSVVQITNETKALIISLQDNQATAILLSDEDIQIDTNIDSSLINNQGTFKVDIGFGGGLKSSIRGTE